MTTWSDLWPGPAPNYRSLEPERSSDYDYYFRCPDCKNLIAVGKWLTNGTYFECDVSGCYGQFYASLPPTSREGGGGS